MKADIRASFVVFLIAVPLAMGIAVASGYPPVAGLITGVIGGVVVGLISGSPLQVSGAAAGLTVLVLEGTQRFGLAAMGIVVALAGLFQMMGAIARLGRWFQAVPPSVLQGMLSGIGALIVFGQLKVMVAPPLPASLGVGLAAVAILFAWTKIPATSRWAGLPAPLLAVVLGAVIAAILPWEAARVSIPSDLFASWPGPFPDFSAIMTTPDYLAFALELALIASAESLLCAAALDRTHAGPRTQFNKELFAQGIGNLLCGFVGALPMTGVAVRSGANVQAGAKTRLSTILHGVWLALSVTLLAGALSLIPRAALAGLLVYTGIKLINIPELRRMAREARGDLAVALVTMTLVVSVDLLWGVAIGLFTAIAMSSWVQRRGFVFKILSLTLRR